METRAYKADCHLEYLEEWPHHLDMRAWKAVPTPVVFLGELGEAVGDAIVVFAENLLECLLFDELIRPHHFEDSCAVVGGHALYLVAVEVIAEIDNVDDFRQLLAVERFDA